MRSPPYDDTVRAFAELLPFRSLPASAPGDRCSGQRCSPPPALDPFIRALAAAMFARLPRLPRLTRLARLARLAPAGAVAGERPQDPDVVSAHAGSGLRDAGAESAHQGGWRQGGTCPRWGVRATLLCSRRFAVRCPGAPRSSVCAASISAAQGSAPFSSKSAASMSVALGRRAPSLRSQLPLGRMRRSGARWSFSTGECKAACEMGKTARGRTSKAAWGTSKTAWGTGKTAWGTGKTACGTACGPHSTAGGVFEDPCMGTTVEGVAATKGRTHDAAQCAAAARVQRD